MTVGKVDLLNNFYAISYVINKIGDKPFKAFPRFFL